MYKHHHEVSIIITLIALSSLLYIVRLDIDTSILALGVFGLYWILSSAYFTFFHHRTETKMFLVVTGTIFLFLFICLLAFLSRADGLTIILGILISTAILIFPISHSITPSDDLKRLALMPQVKRKQFIPFSSCYRLDIDFPDPLYIRDTLGADSLEFSFYLKHEPKTFKLIESKLIQGIDAEGNRVILDISRKSVREHPRLILPVIQRIAKEL